MLINFILLFLAAMLLVWCGCEMAFDYIESKKDRDREEYEREIINVLREGSGLQCK